VAKPPSTAITWPVRRAAWERGGVSGDAHRSVDIGQTADIAAHPDHAVAARVQPASQGAADAAAGTGDRDDRSHVV
jgi:hypothetical protein